MNRKIILSVLVIAVAIGLVGAGTYALWSDSAMSVGNEFKTGNLSLTITSPTEPLGLKIDNMYPGATARYPFKLKNDGSIDGSALSMTGMFANVDAGTLSSVLWVTSIEVGGVEKLTGPVPLSSFNGTDYLELNTGLAKNAETTVIVTIAMDSKATGNMNESVSGAVTFKLDQ